MEKELDDYSFDHVPHVACSTYGGVFGQHPDQTLLLPQGSLK